jgi:glycosyltransferase involved in cell wall biosynthesis
MADRKILIVTNRVPFPLKDGGNIAMSAMIEGYHSSGWKVYLLAMNTSRHRVREEQLKDLYRNLYAFEWMDMNNDLKVIDILANYLFSKKPEHEKRFFFKPFKEKIKSILKSFKPDAVQIESVYLSTYLPVIKKYSRATTILRMHNVEFQIWQGLANKNKNFVKKIYLNNLAERIRIFERAAWEQYDLLIAISEKDANIVNRLEDVNDIIVAPFSVDIDNIAPAKNERWVGYHIGAMDWLPNRDGIKWFLDDAWPIIHRVTPDFEFYFAGRKMPDEFKTKNIPGVHCLDEVASAGDFIADKKILIVPISSSGGIRVKILEAMAAGKIVITTSSGIKGIDARPDEHFLLAKKPEDFARVIKWCLDNKDLAQKISENAIALIKEKYDSGKVIKKVTTEVELLINGSEEKRRSRT